jgi:hypothetical protein
MLRTSKNNITSHYNQTHIVGAHGCKKKSHIPTVVQEKCKDGQTTT